MNLIVFSKCVPTVFVYGVERGMVNDSFIAVFYEIGKTWCLSDIAYTGKVQPDHAK